jgi:hypothetical protein
MVSDSSGSPRFGGPCLPLGNTEGAGLYVRSTKKKENHMNTDSSKKEQVSKGTPRNCSEARRQCENLFFEMSRVVESPGMLMSWVEWFRKLGIPCAIAKTNEGYTLWRKGTEVGRKKSKIPPALIEENIVFSVGLTGRDLDLLKEKEQERAGDSCGGFEDVEDLGLQVGRDLGEAQLDTACP